MRPRRCRRSWTKPPPRPVDDRRPGPTALHRSRGHRSPPIGRSVAVRVPAHPPASLEDFDYDAAAGGVDRKVIEELATCRYLETATNVLLIGPPGGVGKTHLSVGLARAAAHAGYRTYFTTAADLAARCHRAAIEGRWATTMRFYAGPTLLVIDELGYLPLPGEAAAALFQVVSQRYMKTSIVMTTNRGVGKKAHLFARTCAEVALKRDMFAGIRVGRGGRAVGPRRGDRRDRSSLLRVSSRRLPRRVSGRSY